MEEKLVDGKEMASDGSHIPAGVSGSSWIDIEVEVEQSMPGYLDDLDQDLTSQPGFKKLPSRTVTKKITADPECDYIHHGSKRGVGDLMEATADCKYGIITGAGVFPANDKVCRLVLRHLERQQTPCLWRKLFWTEGTTLALFTGVWNYWKLPVIFLPSGFPMTQVNMDLHMIRSRIHLFAQWDTLLYITV